jgi:hypothetical protein
VQEVIRPIETRYAGHRFRSRLEARWAVFFDAAGIEYQYEHEGFNVDGKRYLPDFWLPRLKAFVEIKPTQEAAEPVKPLLRALVANVGDRGILICGPPNLVEPPNIIGCDRHRWWDPAWWLQCSFCDEVSIAIPHAPRCLHCSSIPQTRILHWPSAESPRVDYATQAGGEARFEHGEDPTPAPYVASTPTTLRRVYLAGAVLEERKVECEPGSLIDVIVSPEVLPWRGEIYSHCADGLTSFTAGEGVAGRFRYGGPTIVVEHGAGNHGLASRCLREVAASDSVFAWLDRTSTIGTVAEIGAAHAWRKPRFIAFASETLAEHFYFVRQLADAAVVTPSVTTAWRLFERWQDRVG